jgi:hypothetical protein
MIPNITAYAVLIFCICVTIVAIRLWLQSEKILNWYIKKYSSEPRIIHPPARSRFHSFLVSVFITAFVLIMFSSCTKEYVQNPTCFRYIELSDKYNSEMIFIKTDTLYPSGKLETYACGEDVEKIQNYVPRMQGCETGGYQVFRYVIIKS